MAEIIEKKNITIDGNGSTVLVHGKMTPILLDRCENITIKNLIIDYACPTMSEFKVLKSEKNYNNHIGLPLTLAKLNKNYDYFLFGSN